MSIYIETWGHVQRHAGVEHDHGGIQNARPQPEHVVERRRLECPHPDDWFLADTIVNTKLQHPEFTAFSVWGIQKILFGEALWTAVDASTAARWAKKKNKVEKVLIFESNHQEPHSWTQFSTEWSKKQVPRAKPDAASKTSLRVPPPFHCQHASTFCKCQLIR